MVYIHCRRRIYAFSFSPRTCLGRTDAFSLWLWRVLVVYDIRLLINSIPEEICLLWILFLYLILSYHFTPTWVIGDWTPVRWGHTAKRDWRISRKRRWQRMSQRAVQSMFNLIWSLSTKYSGKITRSVFFADLDHLQSASQLTAAAFPPNTCVMN